MEDLQREEGFSAKAADRIDELVRREDARPDAEYITAVASRTYKRAYLKRLFLDRAEHEYTADEAQAMRTAAYASRSIGLATQGGGFPVPASLDPSLNLVSDGRTNPVRQLARNATVSSNQWQGVNTTGVSSGWYAEFGTVGDHAPTLTQPVVDLHRLSIFVPISFELWQDWEGAADELGRLFADERDDTEAQAFLLGSGSGEPSGLVTAGATVSQSGTATSAVPGHYYNLLQALPARYQPGASFQSSNTQQNRAFRSVAEASTTEPSFVSDDRQSILGKPWYEASYMTTTAAGTAVAFGDIARAYLIADRAGAATELVQNLIDPVSGRPYGARGVFYWSRCGGSVTDTNALRRLVVS